MKALSHAQRKEAGKWVSAMLKSVVGKPRAIQPGPLREPSMPSETSMKPAYPARVRAANSRALRPPVAQIRPTGLVNSKRQFYDGNVFFGPSYYLDDKVVNDYRLVLQGPNKYNNLGRFFMIYYNLETSSYWIKDLYAGPGLFIKLDFPLVLKDKTIINIGNSFLQFGFKSKSALNPEIEVRRLGEENFKM